MGTISSEQVELLSVLTLAVIPEDDVDRGAAEVHAGSALAAKIDRGINTAIYLRGLETAGLVAKERFGISSDLTQEQALEILLEVKKRLPGFYKQLRADVCALYLSEPAVWQRIGFPGPSAESGGYPDFDQPQFVIGDEQTAG